MKDTFGFQNRVMCWVNQTFGNQPSETRRKGFRFMEEATEFVESLGMTREETLTVVNYVFDRKRPGEPDQELGDVMITLAVVAATNNLSISEAANKEMLRCFTNSVKIKAKDKKKPTFVKG